MTATRRDALEMLNSGKKRAALGLHVTLTAPFEPMSEGFTPLRDGRFLPHQTKMLRRHLARRCEPERWRSKIATQLRAFIDAFGHLPDFVDGHQHVHLLPQVREALLEGRRRDRAERLGAAMRPRPRRAAACATQGADARRVEPRAFARRRKPARHRHQSGLRRRLQLQRKARFRQNLSALPRRAAGRRADHVPSRPCRCRTRSGSIRSRT